MDRAIAGEASCISVEVHDDGSVSIADNAPTTDFTFLTTLDYSTGMASGHGLGGPALASALSEWLEITSTDGTVTRSQRFERGEPLADASVLAAKDSPGTTIRYLPEGSFFNTDPRIRDYQLGRLTATQADLLPEVEIAFRDGSRDPSRNPMSRTRGIFRFLPYQPDGLATISEPVIVRHRSPALHVDAALQFALRPTDEIVSYANHRKTDQGPHIWGLTIGAYAALRETGVLRRWSETDQTGGLPRLLGAVSIRKPDAEYEGACRNYLAPSPEVRDAVAEVVREAAVVAIQADEERWRRGLLGAVLEI